MSATETLIPSENNSTKNEENVTPILSIPATPSQPPSENVSLNNDFNLNTSQSSTNSDFVNSNGTENSVNTSVTEPQTTLAQKDIPQNNERVGSASIQKRFSGSRDKCFRCEKALYMLDRIGPAKNNYYHKNCFKCFSCKKQLDIKTYFTNQITLEDKEIYCKLHEPKFKVSLTH